MHTIHWIGVEAESSEDAVSLVELRLEDQPSFAHWSDWNVVGGGRWQDAKVLSFATNPDEFKATIDKIFEWRKEEMLFCLDQINLDKFTSDIVDFISESGKSLTRENMMNNYYIEIATRLLDNTYDCESHFFDLGSADEGVWSANPKYILEAIADPARSALQFLVPVDFHY